MSKKLESEVWNMERCAGCGACVTACSKRIVHFDDDADHPSKKKIKKTVALTTSILDTCHFCDMAGEHLCEDACPRLQEDWKDGPVLKALLVNTAVGKNHSGEPNDVIAYLLAGAMQAGLIDAVVMTDVDRWTMVPGPKVATSIAEIMESAGNQYIWHPTLEGLTEAIYKMDLKKVAVVGTPCNIQALSRIGASGTRALGYLNDRIKIKVGLFCSGVYKKQALKDIAAAVKIPATHIKSVSVSQKDDQLTVMTHDGQTKKMKLSQATNLIRVGCGRCYDLLSEQSDISIGPIGAKKGASVAIVRTSAGEVVLDNAVALGLVATKEGVDEKALAEAKESKKRRKRAEMIDGLQILMLEALRDPTKVEEAKKKFGEIYYKKSGGGKMDTEPQGGCGTCSTCGAP